RNASRHLPHTRRSTPRQQREECATPPARQRQDLVESPAIRDRQAVQLLGALGPLVDQRAEQEGLHLEAKCLRVPAFGTSELEVEVGARADLLHGVGDGIAIAIGIARDQAARQQYALSFPRTEAEQSVLVFASGQPKTTPPWQRINAILQR